MDKPTRQALAENIRTLMSKHEGMNVTNLAKRVGISRGQMNNILTEKSATTIDTLDKIAAVLKTDPSSLLSMGAKTHYFLGLENEITELIIDKYPDYILDVDKLARDLITNSFYQTDDEGKLALLRVAVSMLGWSPELEGHKMPRDWRELASHVADDWGWFTAQEEQLERDIGGLGEQFKRDLEVAKEQFKRNLENVLERRKKAESPETDDT